MYNNGRIYIAGLDVKLEVDRACLREMKIPFVIAAPTVKGFPPLGRAEHIYIGLGKSCLYS